MAQAQLNLARKWRSQTFSQIVGQSLAVRMLQNSLYSGHIFPVYLLSGQRGCGKTSTARVFAAAVNCQKLDLFRKNPRQQQLPCLECASCTAMLKGNHPDVIEMDAASHTGVDNVRQIIEAASFMPLLGTRKIYLIDEAHMLSKAAFNALLKILEEPPETVLFLLATTDPHKIIDTVTSRCFRLFFSPIDAQLLEKHLQAICKKEDIAYDDDGIKVIVAECEGSCRDAINLLEQVRFASDKVTKQAVQRVLGHLDDERLLGLLSTVLLGDHTQLISLLSQLSLANYSASFVWRSCVAMLRAALWHASGVPAQLYAQEGAALIKKTGVSQVTLIKMLKLFYEHEQLFTKTTVQHGMIEMLLIKACMGIGGNGHNAVQPKSQIVAPQKIASQSGQALSKATGQSEQKKVKVEAKPQNEKRVAAPSVYAEATPDRGVNETGRARRSLPSLEARINEDWDVFIQSLAGGGYDPLIVSLFTQGQFKGHDANAGVVNVVLPKSFEMFQEMMQQAHDVWQPLLEQAFGAVVTLQPTFAAQPSATEIAKPQPTPLKIKKPTAPQAKQPQRASYAKQQRKTAKQPQQREQIIDVSDTQKWQKANALVQAFDGVVTQEGEETNE